MLIGSFSIMIIGIIYLFVQMQQPKRVDTASLDVQPSPEMAAYYEKTYGPGMVNDENAISPYYKDQTENLKWIAYSEGYRDHVIYGKKAGPSYSSDTFKGLDKEDLNKNRRLYKKMYKIGYNDAKYNIKIIKILKGFLSDKSGE